MVLAGLATDLMLAIPKCSTHIWIYSDVSVRYKDVSVWDPTAHFETF